MRSRFAPPTVTPRWPWRLLMLSGLMGLISLISPGLVGFAEPVGPWSFNRWTVASLFVLAILTGLGLELGPDRWRRGIRWHWRQCQRCDIASLPIRASGCFCLALSLFNLFGASLCTQSHNHRPTRDQADFLRVAQEVRLTGGTAALLSEIWHGRYHESNRDPFYVALIAIDGTFTSAKTWSMLGGLATWFALVTMVWHRSGLLPAVLAGVLAGHHWPTIHASAVVGCETWLMLWATLTWIAVTSYRNDRRSGWLNALLAAIGTGLTTACAHLTKGTGLFLLAGSCAAWTSERPWRLGTRAVLVLLAVFTFCVVTAPLVRRNLLVYHSPLHNFNNRFLFADGFESGLAEPDLGLVGNAKRFLDRHGWTGLVSRLASGLATESYVFVRLLGPWPLQEGRILPGCVILLALLLAVGHPGYRRIYRGVLVMWIALFIPFFGWYSPIASGDRFLLPLMPACWHLAAVGLSLALRYLTSTNRVAPLLVVGTAVSTGVTWWRINHLPWLEIFPG